MLVGRYNHVFAQKKKYKAGRMLVWSDEFKSKGTPNSANWKFEKGFVRNHELQWYQPDNAYCKRGKLIIEARQERRPNPNYDAQSQDWQPHYLLLNLAIGGDNGGDLAATKFLAKFVIDYVRVYQQ